MAGSTTSSVAAIDALQRIVGSLGAAVDDDWLNGAQSAIDAIPSSAQASSARVIHSIMLEIVAHAVEAIELSPNDDTFRLFRLAVWWSRWPHLCANQSDAVSGADF